MPINLMEKVQPGIGLQFTFADIIVALAVCENNSFFSADQVKILIDEFGFIVPEKNSYSNVIYFDRVDRQAFSDLVLQKL